MNIFCEFMQENHKTVVSHNFILTYLSYTPLWIWNNDINSYTGYKFAWGAVELTEYNWGLAKTFWRVNGYGLTNSLLCWYTSWTSKAEVTTPCIIRACRTISPLLLLCELQCGHMYLMMISSCFSFQCRTKSNLQTYPLPRHVDIGHFAPGTHGCRLAPADR